MGKTTVNSHTATIARFIARRRPLRVTEVAGIAACEQRVVLARRLGERNTPVQRMRARAGIRGHAADDRFVRTLSAWDSMRTALNFGICVGVPMLLIAEAIRALVPPSSTIPHALAAGLMPAAALYEVIAQRSIYADLTSLILCLGLQVIAYALVLLATRALGTAWRARPTTS